MYAIKIVTGGAFAGKMFWREKPRSRGIGVGAGKLDIITSKGAHRDARDRSGIAHFGDADEHLVGGRFPGHDVIAEKDEGTSARDAPSGSIEEASIR